MLVLVVAIVVNVSLVADTMLCFGLRMRIMLIKHSFSCCPDSGEADVHKDLGADTARSADPS